MTKPRPVVDRRSLPELIDQGVPVVVRGNTAIIDGCEFPIVDMATDSDAADVCICKPAPGFFADDIFTWCADCGRAIVHRPHVPPAVTKVCFECVGRRLLRDAAQTDRN